jgi:hypothetical protein
MFDASSSNGMNIELHTADAYLALQQGMSATRSTGSPAVSQAALGEPHGPPR